MRAKYAIWCCLSIAVSLLTGVAYILFYVEHHHDLSWSILFLTLVISIPVTFLMEVLTGINMRKEE